MRFLLIVISISTWLGCSSNLPTSVVVNTNDVQVTKSKGLTFVDNQVFSGILLKTNSVGDTISSIMFLNGALEGLSNRWYANGQIKENRGYKNNRKHGLHEGWYEDGTLAFQYQFEHGMYADTLKEWYSNGQLYLVSVYVNGQQEGRQKAWKRDGELYLNYDVRNGRKYGNSGIKHCKSLWSDVVDGM